MCAFIDISVPAEIIEYPSLHFQDILGGGGGGGGEEAQMGLISLTWLICHYLVKNHLVVFPFSGF